ncbi:MAG: CBS domain-containing protein [Methanobrevibacter sp.]|jgi:CBS domain-containing protein|nr:CBS domain-containing protein [Candidatus Methanoflexus mossambicus]
MKVKEMMDKNFVFVSPEDTIVDVSIRLENAKRFTTPVVDNEMKLIGWITTFDITKGFRENKKLIKEVMSPKDDIKYLHENDPARLAVIETSKSRLVSIPVLDENDAVKGVIRAFEIVDTLSSLYEVKVSKLYEAMHKQLKGVTWDELMDAAAIVTTRVTGKKTKAKDYEERIKNSTFGEAIWTTGGLESFFVGLIAVGELVIARKVGKARK